MLELEPDFDVPEIPKKRSFSFDLLDDVSASSAALLSLVRQTEACARQVWQEFNSMPLARQNRWLIEILRAMCREFAEKRAELGPATRSLRRSTAP